MFSEATTFILYNLLALVCPLLCVVADKTKTKWGVYCAYGILVLVAMMRFDIGSDYENHARMFEEKAQVLDHGTMTVLDWLKPEPLIYLFIFIFKDLEYCYVYVFAAISLTSIIFLYKALEYFKIHTLGLFVFLISFIYFQTWDWARQGMALSIFLYSLKYLEQQKTSKYFLCIFFAIISHYSAFLLVPMYFVYRFAPKHKYTPFILAGSLFFAFVLAEVGIFSKMHDKIAQLIPFYGQVYSGTSYTQNGAGTYHSPTYIMTALMFICIPLFSRKEHSGLATLFSLGAFIYLIAGGNLNFQRMAWYITSVQVVLIPKILADCEVENYNKLFVRYLYMFLLMLAIFERVYIGGNLRDVVPYETIFSEEFDRQQFRPRIY